MSIKEIKKDALASLSGRWGIAIVLSIVTFAFFTFIPMIIEILGSGGFEAWYYAEVPPVEASTLSWIATIAISPILYSYYWLFLDLQRGKSVSVGKLFGNVSKAGIYFKTIGLYLLTLIYTILWSLLLLVPGIIKALAYSQAYFILKDNPDMVVNDVITESRKLMDGYKWKYFLLTLSFIGWALLSILTLGIGLIWLVPYFTSALASFYQNLIEHRQPQNAAI
ncbi:hypothetical protein A8F94_01515 [Bacillus sp. FJAT-27225]|uniref:DUF975 family protein n=1 Tax=Bacillus sp. FJAT-27225 TaxID=1743144 RepID=UPI00080C29BD|nr:DUF975 family protein [Bacillus sp. FJAT-27225]OCA90588.1 hypothetical protein A8F94_01515 [Bacillus sp. FJAT-27225]